MKSLFLVFVALMLCLQYKVWFAGGGVQDIQQLRQHVAIQKSLNHVELKKNSVLRAEIDDLKHGVDTVETYARSELGMLKPGEIFYQFVK